LVGPVEASTTSLRQILNGFENWSVSIHQLRGRCISFDN
jgi:hypothetical protein